MARKGKKYKILIVDDEDEIRDMIKRILRFSAFEVLEAKDGREAIDLVKSIRPDLITLDLMMPEIDGIKVCQQLKTDDATRNIPIIVLTVAGNRARAMEAGADYYLNKLFTIEEFVKVVNRFVQPN